MQQSPITVPQAAANGSGAPRRPWRRRPQTRRTATTSRTRARTRGMRRRAPGCRRPPPCGCPTRPPPRRRCGLPWRAQSLTLALPYHLAIATCYGLLCGGERISGMPALLASNGGWLPCGGAGCHGFCTCQHQPVYAQPAAYMTAACSRQLTNTSASWRHVASFCCTASSSWWVSKCAQRDRELSAAANRRRHPWLMAWWRITRVLRWTWRSPSYLIAQLGFRVIICRTFCTAWGLGTPANE